MLHRARAHDEIGSRGSAVVTSVLASAIEFKLRADRLGQVVLRLLERARGVVPRLNIARTETVALGRTEDLKGAPREKGRSSLDLLRSGPNRRRRDESNVGGSFIDLRSCAGSARRALAEGDVDRVEHRHVDGLPGSGVLSCAPPGIHIVVCSQPLAMRRGELAVRREPLL
jgi:hypothetical protein